MKGECKGCLLSGGSFKVNPKFEKKCVFLDDQKLETV